MREDGLRSPLPPTSHPANGTVQLFSAKRPRADSEKVGAVLEVLMDQGIPFVSVAPPVTRDLTLIHGCAVLDDIGDDDDDDDGQVLSRCSPRSSIPDETASRLEAYEGAFVAKWVPQQAVLAHPVRSVWPDVFALRCSRRGLARRQRAGV
ncbi:hypothetical protein NUW54_g12831 [Trametes sanguinea]|uniref:Uncharacterized protein n=1 Tax=Trametes sanguinea TaxID=158606 RepID=A0ACC1MUZ1_9APHY|nr:hypothetical protein NUW54_g12831 [Trametes sanguinea]